MEEKDTLRCKRRTFSDGKEGHSQMEGIGGSDVREGHSDVREGHSDVREGHSRM